MRKQPTTPSAEKSYARNKALIYMHPTLRESLAILAAENGFQRRKGKNLSALLTLLGLKYARQPGKLLALRRAGFKRIDELLALGTK